MEGVGALEENCVVDRNEWLNWMIEALNSCSNSNVLIHIHGVGGIGKSTLLKHWKKVYNNSLLIDCKAHGDFYARLDRLASEFNRLDIKLPRFDTLWEIKIRYIDRKEPAAKDGKDWVAQAATVVPVIGPIIGQADILRKLGTRLKEILKQRTGSLGNWLETYLGDDFTKEMIKNLFDDVSNAMNLFLKALEDDFNSRPKDKCRPLIVMLDRYETVNRDTHLLTVEDREVNEAELWQKFLSKLVDCVGVTAGRESFDDEWCSLIKMQQMQISEFDENGCKELLEHYKVGDLNLQKLLTDISQKHPFLLDLMCSAVAKKKLTIESVRSLEADSLEETRVKVWNILFDRVGSLTDVIDFAALLPFFNRDTLEILYPNLKGPEWFALTKLSFVTPLDDQWWEMHDLARILAISELGRKKATIIEEIRDNLMRVAESESRPILRGMAISATAVLNEEKAMQELYETLYRLPSGAVTLDQYASVLDLLKGVEFTSIDGKALRETFMGSVNYWFGKPSEAEVFLISASSFHHNLSGQDHSKKRLYKALTYDTLGCLYSDTFRPKQAEENYRIASNLLGELETEEPGTYSLEIATNLNNLANLRSDMNKPAQALTAYKDALMLYKKLAHDDPNKYLTDVGKVLNNLAILYSENCEPDEAEIAYKEALEIYRKLANTSPKQYLRDVAMVLDNLGLLYKDKGMQNEAEKSLMESLRIYEKLSLDYPEMYRSDVAMVNFSLSTLFLGMYDLKKAEDYINIALIIYRELMKTTPELHQGNLADALRILGKVIEETHRPDEAEQIYRESMRIYEELAESASEVYKDEIALVLHNLGNLYHDVWKTDEAELSYQRSLRIFEGLAKDAPKQYEPNVAMVLCDLAHLYIETNRFEKAEKALERALEIYEKVANLAPLCFGTQVATTLTSFADLYVETKRWDKAEETYGKVLDIHRNTTTTPQSQHRHHIADCLNRIAELHLKMRKFEESEKEFGEALEIFQALTSYSPHSFLDKATKVLSNLGNLYSEMGRFEDAEKRFSESLENLEKLTKRDPIMFNDELAETLSDVGNLYLRMGRLEDAERCLSSALLLYDNKQMKSSRLFKPAKAYTLVRVARLFCETGRTIEAETAYMNAISILVDLSHMSSNAYTDNLERLRIEVESFLVDFVGLSLIQAREKVNLLG
ncbi:tetratricopeptide repeat protein [Candidatus Thorarchaeota archaeon]|nr:MAG: tetratricopeptide repeat protein [Candidatus Thorarchaeota archaeon]